MSMFMSVPHLRNSRVSNILLFSSIFFTIFPGLILSADVTLSSIEIFTTHEWLRTTPDVYFQCKEDNKTFLIDVKRPNFLYTFKPEESWQPLTSFSSKKCKRCGFYEQDILSDDVFDEWELCPVDFKAPDGRYTRFKEKEFNATFLCPACGPFAGASKPAPAGNHDVKRMNVAIILIISFLVATVLILGMMVAYKYWQKKKREQDQARFLKLFEEGDDIEDELGLGTMI